MSDTVRLIKDKLSILDVVSPYVELHQSGKSFKGKSPFAAEKTPSFYVSPDRGMYYCFSTSQGGDMFNFVQVMEGVDFKESLKILADKAGVELIPENPQKRSERERLHAAMEAATIFYTEKLHTEPEVLDYIKKRGVKVETIAKWRIGFAPGPPRYGWREIKDTLVDGGYKREELIKAGLIKATDSGKEPFDVFRDRVMFPMAESNGKIVAFSGRILTPNEKTPKYVNSPETDLYKKSELLYGYDKAKTGIRNLKFSLIVEGQFDVVMCHQAGYSNTVAVSGTALTSHHVKLLERLSDKIVLALDADKAGINAMKKAADLMLRRGLDVKVAELPMGKDPADLIQVDPLDFKKYIGQSVHVIEFLLHVLRREITDDRSFKLKAREEVLPFILLLPSRIDQEHFVTKVAESIDTTVDAVRFELDRLREVEKASLITFSPKKTPNTQESRPAKELSVDISHKAYSFLKAATEVVKPDLSIKIVKELEKIKAIANVEEPSGSEFTGLIFSLEQQFATLPPLAIAEEIVSKLNHFKVSLIRSCLSSQRLSLSSIDSDDESGDFLKILKKISEFEILLREPVYEVEALMKEKS